MNEIDVLLDVLLKVCGVAALIAITDSAIKFVNRSQEEIKKEYEERIKNYKEQLEELRELLKTRENAHKEELKRIARTNKMQLELGKAIEAGAVQLRCPKHPEAQVTLLLDGTITCSKGHRIWPPEVEKEVVSHEMD